MKKEDKEEKNSYARTFLENKMRNAAILIFLMDRFSEFQNKETWRVDIAPAHEEFKKLIADRRAEDNITDPVKLADIILYGFRFLAGLPMFSMHEFVQAGAELTDKEKIKTLEEVVLISNDPVKRAKLHPYIAAIGFEIVQHMAAPGTDLAKEVEKRRADMGELIAASAIKGLTIKTTEPWQRGLEVIGKLEDLGIVFNPDGSFEDPEGHWQREQELIQKHAGEQSENTTSGEGAEGIPPSPEGFN